MKTMSKTAITCILASILLGMVVSKATAQCAFPDWLKAAAIQPQSWQEPAQLRRVSFSPAANQEGSDDRIVGFWKVKFLSEGNPGIPDDTVLDNGFVQWHGDGTEIMNSSRSPATGNFCLGVWQKSGPSSYDLNHFGLSFDPGGTLIGPAQIREHVTLNRDADQYEGTFTIDQYDVLGNPVGHVGGRVTAKHIGVNTPVGDVL